MRWPDRSSFRDPANYGLACLSEVAGPLIRGVTMLRGGAKPRPPREWRRAILWGAGHIGDVLYNTASLPALKQGLPQCEWFHAAPSLAGGALAGNPHLAGICDPRDLKSRSGEFDAVVCYNSGASWRETIAAWRWKIPNRAAYVHKGFSALATHPIPIRRPQSYPAYFRDLVASLTGLSPDWPLRPLVYPVEQHRQEAACVWAELALGARPVIAVFVTSRQAAGVWPARNFGEAITLLHKRIDCDTLLLGSAEDEQKLVTLRDTMKLPSRVVAGRMSLLGVVCFLGQCQAVLSTDSGPRHLANAAGAPVFFVPNLAVGRIETGRYLDSEFDLAPPAEAISRPRQNQNIIGIDPGSVAAAIADAVHSSIKNGK